MVTAVGTSANDVFLNTSGNDIFDGLDGYDVVNRYAAGLRGGQFATYPDGVITFTTPAELDIYRSIDQVDFVDGRMVFAPTEPAAQVLRLYEAALDRAPDQVGLNFHTSNMYRGSSLTEVANGFVASAEFLKRFGPDLSNQAYVELLYQHTLDRGSDAAGLQFWTDRMANGATRAEVLTGFSESAESMAKTAHLVTLGIWDRSENAAIAARLYDTLFDRAPEGAGLVFWTDGLDQGYRHMLVAAEGYLASDEARALYGASPSSNDLVHAFYRNGLEREGSPGEINFWTNLLDSGGMTKAEVLLTISESAEHVQLTAGAIGSEDPSQFGITLIG